MNNTIKTIIETHPSADLLRLSYPGVIYLFGNPYKEEKDLEFKYDVDDLVSFLDAYESALSAESLRNYLSNQHETSKEFLIQLEKLKIFTEEKMEQYGNVSEKFNVEKDGYVYFMQAGDYIKIGYSATIHKRVKQLQTGCPYELKLLLALKGTLSTEKAFHKRFQEERYNNEWFNYSFRIREFIESQKSENLQLT